MSSNGAGRENRLKNGLGGPSFSSSTTCAYFQLHEAYHRSHQKFDSPSDHSWGRYQPHEGRSSPFGSPTNTCSSTQACHVAAPYYPSVEYGEPSSFIMPPCPQLVPHVLPLPNHELYPMGLLHPSHCCIYHNRRFHERVVAPILPSVCSESLINPHAPVCLPLVQGTPHMDTTFTGSTFNNVGQNQYNYFIQVAPQGSAGDRSNGKGVDEHATIGAAPIIAMLPESITNSPTSATTITTFRYSFFEADRLSPQIRSSCLQLCQSDGAVPYVRSLFRIHCQGSTAIRGSDVTCVGDLHQRSGARTPYPTPFFRKGVATRQ